MAFRIIRNDITKVTADAIVNTANPDPVYASGTDGAIYAAAGADELLAERKKIGTMEVGEAKATPAFALDAKYIIHTVGPAWDGGDHGEFEDLRKCYTNSLYLAEELNCESIAFPLISTGVFGFPKDKALQIAVAVFSEFLSDHEMEITLVVFDPKSFELSGQIFAGVDEFIDNNYVYAQMDAEYFDEEPCAEEYCGEGYDAEEALDETPDETPVCSNRRLSFLRRHKEDVDLADVCYESPKYSPMESAPKPSASARKADVAPPVASSKHGRHAGKAPENAIGSSGFLLGSPALASASSKPIEHAAKAPEFQKKPRTLDDAISHISDTWQESLLHLIDEKNLTDVEVYKRANVDRKLFSKIRGNKDYKPGKITAIAFALALELNLDETKDMLARAGYALSPSSTFDLIIKYFIEQEYYDIININLALFDHDQPLIGA